jgi:hypothetical protein
LRLLINKDFNGLGYCCKETNAKLCQILCAVFIFCNEGANGQLLNIKYLLHYSCQADYSHTDFAVAKYDSNGILETSINGNGKITRLTNRPMTN